MPKSSHDTIGEFPLVHLSPIEQFIVNSDSFIFLRGESRYSHCTPTAAEGGRDGVGCPAMTAEMTVNLYENVSVGQLSKTCLKVLHKV
jgi:hypothetical protein